MPSVTIQDVSGLPHFATVYQWNATFVFPSTLPEPGDPADYNARCLSTEMPSMSGQSIDVQIRGHHIKQHGIYDSQHTLNMTFVETIDNKISNLFTNWRRLCWKLITGAQGQRNDVKGQILLERLGPDLAPIWSCAVYGVFLEAYDPGGMLDGSQSAALNPSLTISYDYFVDNKQDGEEE